MALTCIGTFGIVVFGFAENYFYIVPPFILCGIGLGIGLTSITTAGVGAVKESMSSLAGGIIMMFQLSGSALGIAIVTTIFIDTSINDLIGKITELDLNLSNTDIGNIKSFMLGSNTEQAFESGLGSSTVDKLLPYIRDSYVKGLKIGLSFTGFILLIGTALTLFFTKSRE